MTEALINILKEISKERSVTIEEAVKISLEKGFTQELTAKTISQLDEEGKIKLIDTNPPENIGEYLLSYYSSWFWLVLSALVMMSLTIYVIPNTAPINYIRIALGFTTSLYLPGYTLIEALYPKKDELESLERIALSIGLSIALTPLTGFILNYTPWGIRLNSTTASITILTVMLGLIAVYRKFAYFRLRIETLRK